VLGKTLQSKEGFRDAFIAQTTEADVILAWLHSRTAE
jgi:hypothetical protein